MRGHNIYPRTLSRLDHTFCWLFQPLRAAVIHDALAFFQHAVAFDHVAVGPLRRRGVTLAPGRAIC